MIGETISHYRITAQLGEGGMGIVYRADDLKLDRQVAIKVLPPRLSQHPEARVRLLREAKAASALQHANICTIHEIDDTEDGQLFMVMPCYEGETLRERLDRAPMTVEEALEIGRQISSALAATHEKGIVHRDLKPGNIMLTNGGTQAVLMDFGLARPDEATQLTRTGATVGTIAYMSPEQVRGERADERSDLWSLGVVLYEMTTGRRPFEGDGEVPVLESILHKDPAPASRVNEELSPAFAAMLDQLLTKDPQKRSADASTVTQRLVGQQEVVKGTAIGTDAPLSWRWRNWTRHHRIGVRAGLILIAALIALGVWKLWPAPVLEINSLAVLPFTDLSPEQDQEWFCDGMADELIHTLVEIGIPVHSSRTSMQRYKGTELTLKEIADELDADALLESSVLHSNNRVRVNTRLILGDSEEEIWADSIERDIEDVFELHADLATLIARRIHMALDPEDLERLARRRKANPEAVRLYLQAKHVLYSGIQATEDSLEWRGIAANLRTAVSLEPDFAEAWATLAEWGIRSMHEMQLEPQVDQEQLIQEAEEALDRALAIDGDLHRAQIARAHLMWEHAWRQDEATDAFERSLELSPTDGYTHALLSYNLMTHRRFAESAEAGKKAVALEPHNPFTYLAREPVRVAGDYDAALAIIEGFADRFEIPADSWWLANQLAAVHLDAGRYDKVHQLAEPHPLDQKWFLIFEAHIESGDSLAAEGVLADVLALPDSVEVNRISLANAHARLGNDEEARILLPTMAELGRGWTTIRVAYIYGVLGDMDSAFGALERAYEVRNIWLPRINCYRPYYETLHGDDRFADLIERMGFEPPSRRRES